MEMVCSTVPAEQLLLLVVPAVPVDIRPWWLVLVEALVAETKAQPESAEAFAKGFRPALVTEPAAVLCPEPPH